MLPCHQAGSGGAETNRHIPALGGGAPSGGMDSPQSSGVGTAAEPPARYEQVSELEQICHFWVPPLQGSSLTSAEVFT